MMKRIWLVLTVFLPGVYETNGQTRPSVQQNESPQYEGKRFEYWLAQSKSSDPERRHAAVQALGRLRPTPNGAVAALIASLADSDHLVRYYAVVALGVIGPEAKASAPALIRLCNDDD